MLAHGLQSAGVIWCLSALFLREHPAQAMSWCTAEFKRITKLEEVDQSVAHQCQYGAQHEGHPIKKPTGFIALRKALSKTCTGKRGQYRRSESGDHILCNGRVARFAAMFPVRRYKAILSGFSNQLRRDGVTAPGVIGMHEAEHGKKMSLPRMMDQQ